MDPTARYPVPLDTVLLTPRCRLRRIEPTDASSLWSAIQQPGFVDGLGWHHLQSMTDVYARIDRDQNDWRQGQRFAWTILPRDLSVVLGGVTIAPEPEVRTWMMSYWIHPTSWGQGYATEAAQAVLDFGFSALDAVSIWAGSALWNTASRRVLEKLGMLYRGANPKGYELRGQAVETEEFEMPRQVWQTQRSRA